MNDKGVLNDLRDYLKHELHCNNIHCTYVTLLHLSCCYCMYNMADKDNTINRCMYKEWKVL